MEVVNQSIKRKDNNLIVITHLSQLLCYITGFGSLIVPLVIWLSTRDTVEAMDEHGKAAVNFQLSLILYVVISIPAILLLGLGILMLIGVGLIGFVVPIVNAIRAGQGEAPTHIFTIPFIK